MVPGNALAWHYIEQIPWVYPRGPAKSCTKLNNSPPVTKIPIIHVFVIVFVSLLVDISSFLFIILNLLGVLLIICIVLIRRIFIEQKNVTCSSYCPRNLCVVL